MSEEATHVIDNSLNLSVSISCNIMTINNINNNIYRNMCNELIRSLSYNSRCEIRKCLFLSNNDNFISDRYNNEWINDDNFETVGI